MVKLRAFKTRILNLTKTNRKSHRRHRHRVLLANDLSKDHNQQTLACDSSEKIRALLWFHLNYQVVRVKLIETLTLIKNKLCELISSSS